MKLFEVVSVSNGLRILDGKRLPAKINYALMKNKKALLSELQGIQEQRIEIMKSHAKKDDNGEPVSENGQFIFESDADREEATKEYAELLNVDANIDIMTVTFDDIVKCDDMEPLTTSEIEALEFMID
jgi:hypothetical protein|nr:MAG TPA: Protein of unknown function (DUF1617) [Caudoviricetes sp.]